MENMPNWPAILGTDTVSYAEGLVAARPPWVIGSLSQNDAVYLFNRALAARAEIVVEIGTASGFSTALLCHALNFSSTAGLVSQAFRVATYDVTKRFYADNARNAGDAAREMLPEDLLGRIEFRAPAFAYDVPGD